MKGSIRKKQTETLRRGGVRTGQKAAPRTGMWVAGFILMALSLVAIAAVLSYLFTWRSDQMFFASRGDIPFGEMEFRNLIGGAGAWIGYVLVTRFAGLFGVCVPVIMFLIGVRMAAGRAVRVERSLRIAISVMILGSVTLGYLFRNRWGVFGSSLGGWAGWAVADAVSAYIRFGEAILLAVAWVLLAVYLNRRTIDVVNNVGGGIRDVARGVVGGIHHEASTDTAADDAEEETVMDPARRTHAAVADDAPEADADDLSLENEPDAEATQTDATAADPVLPDPDVDVIENYADELEVVPSAPDVPVQAAGASDVSDAAESKVQVGSVMEATGKDDLVVVDPGAVTPEVDEEFQGDLYDPTRELSMYECPPIDLLENRVSDVFCTTEEIEDNKRTILRTLEDFGIQITRITATVGPTVTLYELEPAPGIKISRIKSLEENIALALRALSIRMIAPMPGKGTIGIEIPNRNKQIVSMYSVIKSVKFQESRAELPIVIGRTIYNEPFVFDLAKMPHLIVAGATGQGKSVGLNAIITSLLYKKHPSELKFVLVDPKKVELSIYRKLERHFLAKMESEEAPILTDNQKVLCTINSLCMEMDARYELLRLAGVRKISEYNEKFLHRRLNPNKGHRYLPYIVLVIDEFADLIMTAGKEVERPISRLAQLARAIGIHLIIATQRPDVKVITGLIKNNIPARIAFKVPSMIDSRTILDQAGANKLVGQGDMLMLYNSETTRIQCAFVDTPEIERIVDHISRQQSYQTAYLLPDYGDDSQGEGSGAQPRESFRVDPEFREVASFVVGNQTGSTTSIQRNFSFGYVKAGRIMDQLEKAGIVGRQEGSKPREVLVYDLDTLDDIFTSLGV